MSGLTSSKRLCFQRAISRETWSTTKRDEKKFAVAKKGVERRMYGVIWIDRLSSEELRHEAGVKDVSSEIYAAK
uniref:Uncharacterized protein n=1 Tax=Ascaris lumbricoides TaxID=6252 RepID=A0A0M3HPS8_ASCLU